MNAPEIEARTLAFYGQLDLAIVKALGGRPVSCLKGCAHCCYMLAECGIGEAIAIASEVAGWPDWRDVARALYAHAAEQTQRGVWKDDWFNRHVPCPFLTRDNLCRVYEWRPVACRCHFVRSPPDNCALGAADPRTERYDAGTQAVPWVQALDAGIFRDYPELGPLFVGLLSHLVLFALRYCLSGGDRRWLDKRLAKLPTPREWTIRSVGQQARAMARGDAP